MWKVTWKGLLSHKLRFALTAVSVVLGVSFMAGTLVLTATINATFDDLFAGIYEGTDAQVRGIEPVDAQFGPGSAPRLPVDASALDVVRGVNGVAVAEPFVAIPYAQVVDGAGDPIGGGVGPPTFGQSWVDNEDLNPFQLVPGSEPPGVDDEIVIDKGTAKEGGIAVGDRVDVLSLLPTKQYTVVGIAKFGTQDSQLGASVIQFTLPESQRINGMAAADYSNIGVVADSGVTQEQVRDNIAGAIADTNVEVLTGKELTEENQNEVAGFLDIFNRVLLVFALVALFVSCFIIYNTFSIIVAQRTREMALLRAIGASTRQVTTSILLESIAVGVFASLVGFVAGIALAAGLKVALDAFGLDIPAGDIVVPPIAFVLSFAAGLIVTVVSAMIPARRASRVPPVAAMRDVAIEHRHGFGYRIAIGVFVTVGGAALMLFALFGSPGNAIYYLGVGAVAVIVGVIVVGPVVAVPVSRVIGWPLPRVRGIVGDLARENALRNPRRTSATATALMVGVSLVGFITILAASTKASVADTLDAQLRTDFIVTGGSGFGVPLSPAIGDEMAALPELGAVSPLRFAGAAVDGRGEFMTALNTETEDELFDLGVSRGTLGSLDVDGIALSTSYADDHDLLIGDTLDVVFPATGLTSVQVRALYQGNDLGLTGKLLISIESFDAHYLPEQRVDFFVLARLAPGVTTEEGAAAIERVLEPYPTAKLQNNAEFRESQEATIAAFVNLVYALLFLAVIIAVIGIANTLALSIYERTRELGLLRAVGTTRRQLKSMVRWEAVIIAVLGTLLGLVIGFFFGWSVVLALEEDGFSSFDPAPGQLVIIVIVAGIAGVLAAVFPARRAAKLDVLKAISTE